MEYSQMLDDAFKKIKKVEGTRDRFEVPKPEGLVEGNKTIITNFGQISSYLRREPEHLAKFLEKELAAYGKIENERLILVKKILPKKLNEKLDYYIEKYVFCKECKKPDTEILKQENFFFIHCMACGAKYSIPKI